MPLKILATADLHLGKSSSSLPESIPESSTRHTLEQLVKCAKDYQVDILTLSGDIVDQDNQFYEADGPLRNAFDQLKKAGISIYMVAGNHDHKVLSQLVKENKYEHVKLLGRDGKWESVNLDVDNSNIQLLGWSFTKSHIIEDPLQQLDSSMPDPNKFTIGLLHGEVDTPDSQYAPITLSNFNNSPVDAWILGHIHKPELKERDPFIVYTGSPHALSPAEPGVHGPLLIEISEADEITSRPVPLSPIRYEALNLTVNEQDTQDSLRENVTSAIKNKSMDFAEELDTVVSLVYDIILTGNHPTPEQVKIWLQPAVEDYSLPLDTGTNVTIRKIKNHLQPAVGDLETLAKQTTPTGIIADTMLAIQNGSSTPFLENMIEEWREKTRKMNNSGTYSPLSSSGLQDQDDDIARQYILQECKSLLSTLIAQQENQ